MNLDSVKRITRDGRWIPEIDGLRFIAIFSVVLFHFGGELGARSGRFIPVEPRYTYIMTPVWHGDRGVVLFFVISGMILAMPFARYLLAQGKKVSLRKYYLRRVTRLEPPYILSVILFIVLFLIYSRGHLEPGYGWHALASLFYLHSLTYGQVSPVNPVTWSLEVEIQFYLLAPFVMQLFRIKKKSVRRVVLAAAVAALGVAQIPFAGNPRVVLSILFYLQYFLIGLLLADIFVLDLEQIRSSWMWDVAALLALAFVYLFGQNLDVWHALLPYALAVLCLAAMRSLLFRRFVANRWIAVTGGMCYSIYLLHLMVMAVVFKVTRRLIVPQFNFVENFLVQCVAMGIPVLVVSVLFFRLVERPCMDPEWPSKLWHWVTGRSGDEVEALDTMGVSEDAPVVKP
jgi:peptidoglycan/LPS O-acetylase OafA/YrhL